MQVNEIMSTDLITIAPEATLAEAALLMEQEDLGALPVADDGALVGFLTDRDVTVRGVAQGMDPHASVVGEVMTPAVICCRSGTTIAEAARQMEEHHIRRIIVRNESDEAIGIVSLADIALFAKELQIAARVLEEVSRPI